MIIKVKVTPNSKEDKVVSFCDDVLKLKVKAPPEDGKANQAVIELLAKHFQVPKRCVIIKSGHSSKEKIVIIDQLL